MMNTEPNPEDLYDPDDKGPICESCGVALVDHLGLIGTCRQLQEAREEIERLRKLCANALFLAKHDYPHFEDKCRACKLREKLALAGGGE